MAWSRTRQTQHEKVVKDRSRNGLQRHLDMCLKCAQIQKIREVDYHFLYALPRLLEGVSDSIIVLGNDS